MSHEPDRPEGREPGQESGSGPVSPPARVALGLVPCAPLRGRARVPASKSFAQRALLCAALAEGRTELSGDLEGEDIDACRELARQLGARVETIGCATERADRWGIEGTAERKLEGGALDAGESATLARFATAVVALAYPEAVELGARGSLRSRSSAPLLKTLGRAARRELEPLGQTGSWPLRIHAQPHSASARAEEPGAGTLRLEHPVSSQEVSALLLASAAMSSAPRVEVVGKIPSRPYLDITVDVLKRFGVTVETWEANGVQSFRTQGRLLAPSQPLRLESDASSAAVVLAAGCLSDGELSVSGIAPSSPQGDLSVVRYLREFGCRAGHDGDRLWAGGAPVRGAHVHLEDHPDLAPVLAAVAAGAVWACGASSSLSGLGGLRGKESDRLEGLARALGAIDVGAGVHGDTLVIGPLGSQDAPERRVGVGGAGVWLDSRGDHRMAFAMALLGLIRPGVRVRDSGSVGKSWPSFWGTLESLGAAVLWHAESGPDGRDRPTAPSPKLGIVP